MMKDMTGVLCSNCQHGKFKETDSQDDMFGILHCTCCGIVSKRWLPLNEADIKLAMSKTLTPTLRWEVGLQSATKIIDCVQILDHAMIGYEIKSDADSLSRLKHQALVYDQIFDYLVLVVGKHGKRAESIIPEHWGIMNLDMTMTKEPCENPNVDLYYVADLLWRPEMLLISQEQGLVVKSKMNRTKLKQILVQGLEPNHLKRLVRCALLKRQGWGMNI